LVEVEVVIDDIELGVRGLDPLMSRPNWLLLEGDPEAFDGDMDPGEDDIVLLDFLLLLIGTLAVDVFVEPLIIFELFCCRSGSAFSSTGSKSSASSSTNDSSFKYS